MKHEAAAVHIKCLQLGLLLLVYYLLFEPVYLINFMMNSFLVGFFLFQVGSFFSHLVSWWFFLVVAVHLRFSV